AWRIRNQVDQEMARIIADGIRTRGLSPEDCALFSFGGAGPLHACATAELIRIPRVVAFPFGSTFSAFGSSTVDVVHRYGHTFARSLDQQGLLNEINRAIDGLQEQAHRDMRGEGFGAEA